MLDKRHVFYKKLNGQLSIHKYPQKIFTNTILLLYLGNIPGRNLGFTLLLRTSSKVPTYILKRITLKHIRFRGLTTNYCDIWRQLKYYRCLSQTKFPFAWIKKVNAITEFTFVPAPAKSVLLLLALQSSRETTSRCNTEQLL